MADDGRMAFARLFSQRRETLDMSVVDIAVQTGRPIEVVVGWDQGTVVPDIDDLTKVSEVLKLPQPLLEEALRRVTDHGGDSALDPQSPQESDNETDPQTDGEPATASRGTLIPASLASATFTDRLSQIPQHDVALRYQLAGVTEQKTPHGAGTHCLPVLSGVPRPADRLPPADRVHGRGGCRTSHDPSLVPLRPRVGNNRSLGCVNRSLVAGFHVPHQIPAIIRHTRERRWSDLLDSSYRTLEVAER